MKKGIFSLMMGLILAFTGMANAQTEVTIGTGTSTSYYVPYNSLYNYSFSEMIWTADEILDAGGSAGQIIDIAFQRSSGTAQTNTYTVYMKNVSRSSFSSSSDYETVTSGDIVFNGTHYSSTTDWETVTLDTPFAWDGSSNLMIAVWEQTGTYNTEYYYYSSVSNNCMIQFYSDSYNPNPYSLGSYSGSIYTRTYHANLRMNILTSGPQSAVLTLDPDPVDFGYRPNNCWMRPIEATLTNEGPRAGIYGVDVDNAYFVPSLPEDTEIPFFLGRGESVNILLDWTSAPEGEVNGVLVVDGQARDAFLFDLMANAYEPVEPDVWEMARVVTSYPYRDTPTTVALYNNYVLPPAAVEDGNDAVYKVTFDHDVMLNGNVVTVGGTETAENGKMAVYTQAGINEVGGPDLNNNYTGPQLAGAGSAPYDVVFGDETTTSTTGYYPCYYLYNYSLSESLYHADDLQAAGMGAGPITGIGYNSTSTYGYTVNGVKIWMANVTDTEAGTTSHSAAGMTCVYEGSFTQVQGWNEFALNGAFAWDGTSNLLVIFQMNNGSWDSSISWKYVSTDYVAGFVDFNDNNPYSPETNTYSYYYNHNYLPVTHFVGGGRGNRAEEVVFSDDFESGSATGWTIENEGTSNGWELASSDGHSHYAQGNYAMFDMGSYSGYYNDLYSPSIDLTNATSATLSFDYINPSWAGDYNYLAVYAYVPAESYWYLLGEPTAPMASWTTITYDLTPYCGKEIQINFYDDFEYGYGTGIDNVVVTAEMGAPVPPVPGDNLINNMTMLPGTYYIAASSTADAWDVILNASELPCPDEITAEANCVAPFDDEDGIDPSSVTLKWHLSPYTTEYRLLFGSTYYCENVLVDWTRDLAESYTVRNLFNNTNYFWRIEERNAGCPQGIQGPVWGFTTTFNAPTNLHSTNANGVNIYEGETLHLAWTPIVDRTFRMYKIYQDGELIGQTPSNPDPNATTTFDVEGLEYNMGGYSFNVTAVYDEGESAFSNTLTIKVSGEGEVDGHVYEQDGVTGIAGATVTFVGTDEFGRPQTYTFTTDGNGYYSGNMNDGEYNGQAACNGYQTINEPVQGNPVAIDYANLTSPIDFIMDEVYTPVGEVIAEYYPDPEDPESPYVKVYWSWNIMSAIIEDFETGDFSQFEYNFPDSYPWEIVTTHPYEGQYCMKSGGTNIASASSSVEVTVEIPRDGLMSFYSYISCESSWDMGYYYMDGAQMGSVTGLGNNWVKKEFAVTEGTHTFKWTYTKDSSVNSGEDAWFVDYIDFIHDPEPAQPGWHTYAEGEFDNALGSNVGTSNWAYLYPNGGGYAGMTLTKVALFSDNQYSAVGGNYTLNVILGGATPDDGTVAATMTVDVPGNQNAWLEWDLPNAVSITGNENVWVVWTANSCISSWPAGMAAGSEPNGSWWNGSGGNGWEQMIGTYGEVWTMKQYFTNRSGRTFEDSYMASNHAVAPAPQYGKANPVKGQENESGVTVCNPNVKHTVAAQSNDRSFQYFRVYRTDCYNDGPYTSENTVVCCCELHDTLYIDVEWPELAPGVYKWGVGCVYGGNRGEEIVSPITWANVENQTVENVMAYEPATAPNMEQLTGKRTAPAKFHEIKSNNPFRGSTGYVDNTYGNVIPSGLCVLDIDNPQGATSLNPSSSLYAGEIVDGVIYGYTSGGYFVTFDPETGAQLSSVYAGTGIREMAYDYTTSTMYGSSTSDNNLYRIDMTNGSYTVVGTMSNVSAVAGLVCDLTGQLYAMAFTTGDLYKVDKTNASMTLVGNTGRTPAYVQSAAIDYATGICYWAYSDASYDDLYTVDLATAQANFVCSFVESCGLCFPYAGAPVPPDPDPQHSEIQEERESPIVWSNCLDKDMYLNGAVDITVLLNSADSPEGVNVSFTNLNAGEQEFYPVEPVVLDGTGYYAWDTFRRGDYVLNITMGDAYEPITDTVSIWDATSLRYVMIEIIYGVSDLYVSHTGWAMWEGEGPVGPVPPHGDEFTFGFEEDPIANGWTIQQLNETSWVRQEGATGFGAAPHEGNYHMWLHWAYGDQDEWLITPEFTVPANGNLNFWTYATLGSTYGDHYYAKITVDGGNTWNVLWDASAQPAGTNYYTTPINCDLSAYAGQAAKIAWQGYMADGLWYAWCIDDITVSGGREVISFDGRQWFRQETNTTEVGEPVAYSKAGDVEPRNGERHLEGYKVLCTSIDGEPIFSGNTVHPFIQVDTEELVEGENYICKVAAIYSTGMSDWTVAEWQYKSCENYGEAQNVAAEGQTITWEYPAGPVPPPIGDGDEFTVDFESGLPTGWNVIDGNNDGATWCLTSAIPTTWTYYASLTLDWYHNGTNAICSGSYINGIGAMNPDEYLVSPQVTLVNGSQLSFWAAATDASYPADHFGVFVSDNGTSDWTMVNEWTLTAKGNYKAGDRASRDGEGLRLGTWYNYTVDLSAYAGQKYIAIRHFNCYDQYIMCVDDIELTAGAKSNRDEYIQYCTETFSGGVGTGGGEVWWAVKFPATSLAAYAGQSISKLGIFTDVDGDYGWTYSGNYELSVFAGTSAPTTLLGGTGMQYVAGDLAWHDLELPTAVAIDGTQDLWIVGHTTDIAYPMSGCDYVGDANSDYLSLDNSTWEHAGDYGLAYTWMLRAFVTGGSPVPPDPTGNVLGAMIFRDGEWIAEVAYPTNEYTDEEGSGNYCVRIIYDGTAVLPDQNEYYSMSCPVCTESDDCAAGADIYGEYVWNNANDYGALITWGGAPVPPPGPGDEWSYSFDTGFDGWTTIDADGDGHNWYHSTEAGNHGTAAVTSHSGAGHLMSESYCNATYAALTPDEYVVSPVSAITNGSTFSFWVCAQDASYAAEHYGVAVSTDGTNFTTIEEWTLTAKGGNEVNPAATRDGRNNREGNWYQKTVDLSEYAGQSLYIAVRHFNCSDQFILLLDDAELSIVAKGNRAGIVKYNVYRSTDNVNYEFIGSVDAVAGQEEYSYYDETAAGTYYYQVRADYGDCESEPAKSGVNPSDNFVIVNVTSVAENGEIALYPNPTNGNITIQAQNMNRITVVSVLGQVVYDVEVEGDSQIINMTQFNAGVYMVRIATENGVSTQRVTVVK